MQRKAFKIFNQKLRARLQGMGTSDRTFWDVVKEIGGLENSRSAAAPDAEALGSSSGISLFLRVTLLPDHLLTLVCYFICF